MNLPTKGNAVAAIRVSSVKQGLQGDSPEDQKEQIERYARNHDINVKKYFVFMESASKEQQPVQEAINYCKSSKNNIQLFIVKSIDRFTRGGSYSYDHLKMQLNKSNVRLVDIYGVISNQQVNTLEHLGVEYDWSIYSPTKKTEILEAERAKDEMRDIMTRMIGAEIRYVRMGYRVRQAPYGYQNEKTDTQHGKRVILNPHPEESHWIKMMYKLRSRGTLNDPEIVDEINKAGFKARSYNRRDINDKTKVIGKRGGGKLTLKRLWRYIKNPVYAGLTVEKWTGGEAVKGKFDGIVSIETFNKANKGKIAIKKTTDGYELVHSKKPDYLLNRKSKTHNFPYRRHVLCPHCKRPLYGSASRGKLGKYYPAYHCNKRGHYFRVSSDIFHDTVEEFIKGLNVKQDYIDKMLETVMEVWTRRKADQEKEFNQVDRKIAQLKMTSAGIVDKIKVLGSETAIRYMEDELIKAELEVKELEAVKTERAKSQNEIDMEEVVANARNFLEHLEELLIDRDNPVKSAEYFSLIFKDTPTYEDLISGTPQLAPFLAYKDSFDDVLVQDGDPKGI